MHGDLASEILAAFPASGRRDFSAANIHGDDGTGQVLGHIQAILAFGNCDAAQHRPGRNDAGHRLCRHVTFENHTRVFAGDIQPLAVRSGGETIRLIGNINRPRHFAGVRVEQFDDIVRIDGDSDNRRVAQKEDRFRFMPDRDLTQYF
ncbi:MAG: hypothetical protein U0872_03365 [Planctomycetaceae bacterium]